MKRTIITAAIMALALPAMAQDTAAPEGAPTDWNQGGGEQDEALGLTPDHENGVYTYEVCSACHGLNGWGLPDGTFPQIAGQHPNVAIKQLGCRSCHGPDGSKPTNPKYPFISGMNPAYAIRAMTEIRDKVRTSGQAKLMWGTIKKADDDEIEAIATWLATIDRSGT